MATIDADVLAGYIGGHEEWETHDVVPVQVGHEDMELTRSPGEAAQCVMPGKSRAGTHVQQNDIVATRAQFNAGRIAAIGATHAERQVIHEAARLFERVQVQAGACNQRGCQLAAQLLQSQGRGQRAARAPEPDGDSVAGSCLAQPATRRLRGCTGMAGQGLLQRRVAGKQGVEATDLEDLRNQWLHAGDGQSHAGGARLLRRDHQLAQARAGNIFHAREVEHDPRVGAAQPG